jgi:lipoate-protein ligase A
MKATIYFSSEAIGDVSGGPIVSWRLIRLNVCDAYSNMAIDEAILTEASKGIAPNTLRLYAWKPSAVSIGYFQSVRDVVDLEACRRLGVDVVRRMTGGGAVYHDQTGEITYSLIVRENDPRIPRDILESYEVICGGIIEGLRRLHLKAEFQPINDVLVRGKKISGNAQTRRNGVLLQHGTLLLDFDPESMSTLLRISHEKIRDKMIANVGERLTSLRKELNKDIVIDETSSTIVRGFEKSLGVGFISGQLSKSEAKATDILRRSKYTTDDWNFQR